MSVSEYFSRLSVSAIVSSRKDLISLGEDETVEVALSKLKKHNCLSAPVISADAKRQPHPFLGIAGVVDILMATALAAFSAAEGPGSFEEKLADVPEEKLLAGAAKSSAAVFAKPIKTALGITPEAKAFRLVEDTEKLTSLLTAMSTGVHRVIVRHQDGAFSYLSQTDIVNFIHQQLPKEEAGLAPFFKKTLAELKMAQQDDQLIKVSAKSRAIVGFHKMMMAMGTPLSAIPVVDKAEGSDQEILVDTLSSSDFRGVRHDSLSLLLLPVQEFLKLSRAKPRKPVYGQRMITATLDEKLDHILERLLSSKLHRLWVVNEHEAPIGVVTLTDVIRVVAAQCEGVAAHVEK